MHQLKVKTSEADDQRIEIENVSSLQAVVGRLRCILYRIIG